MVKVGIPRSLMYYLFFPMWKTFFEELGAEVVVSGPTTKKIMDDGVRACVDEACLALKVYFGHVLSLKDKVDFLFIPRLTSLSRNEYVCPKFGGLPDMIRSSIGGLPRIIDTELNLRRDKNGLLSAAMEIGGYFSTSSAAINLAYKKAVLCQREYSRFLRTGAYPTDILEKNLCDRKRDGSRLQIAVIGHCYNLYDSYINMGLLKKLERAGVSALTVEMMEEEDVNRKAAGISKRMFWYFGRKAVGTALCMLERQNVDGMLYVMAFGCGVDSFVCDYVERLVRNRSDMPFAVITLDEHTGEAGLDTRVEAFADMIRWRHGHEADFSTHGQHIYCDQGTAR